MADRSKVIYEDLAFEILMLIKDGFSVHIHIDFA